MLVRQLTLMMPELRGVSPWPVVGQRRLSPSGAVSRVRDTNRPTLKACPFGKDDTSPGGMTTSTTGAAGACGVAGCASADGSGDPAQPDTSPNIARYMEALAIPAVSSDPAISVISPRTPWAPVPACGGGEVCP